MDLVLALVSCGKRRVKRTSKIKNARCAINGPEFMRHSWGDSSAAIRWGMCMECHSIGDISCRITLTRTGSLFAFKMIFLLSQLHRRAYLDRVPKIREPTVVVLLVQELAVAGKNGHRISAIMPCDLNIWRDATTHVPTGCVENVCGEKCEDPCDREIMVIHYRSGFRNTGRDYCHFHMLGRLPGKNCWDSKHGEGKMYCGITDPHAHI